MEKEKNNAFEKTQNIANEKEFFDGVDVNKEVQKTDAETLNIEKREERRVKKEGNDRRTFGGLIATAITFGITSLIFAVAWGLNIIIPSERDNALEATYQKSFFDTVEQVDNIDLNLSKALASSDNEAIQLYLSDTAINSELCENDLQQLPIEDENKYYTTKLINQIGDYSKYLNKKLVRGESLSREDRENLYALYRLNGKFKNALGEIIKNMGRDYSFSSLSEKIKGDAVLNGFNELQNLSAEYPELIYDGPFSDGITEREIKGLSGDEIDENRAKEIFISVFSEHNPQNVKNVGVTVSEFECFNVQGEVNGEYLYAQISKIGGKLVMFSFAGSCRTQNYDIVGAEAQADDFLAKLGINNMYPVWFNLDNNVFTINYAYTDNDVIIYSDLIKIRVCAETGMVIGMEASSYYTNHTEREISSPAINLSVAEGKISENMDLFTARLVVIPIGVTSEKLCYEFSGIYDGATYYVYIDAVTVKQVEMFKVIESGQGMLLM
ncbi:MAG: germination protein YpeB [Clostridia bacterium]|nr:germination protein YpeB [Clostridia bacterium]